MEGQCEIVKEQKEFVSNVRELYKNIHNNKKREFEAIDNTLDSPEAKRTAKNFASHIFIIANQLADHHANGTTLPADSVRQALAAASGAGDTATQADAVDAVDAATQADAVDAATQADAVADAHILDVDLLPFDADILDVDLLPVDADILDLLLDEKWMC